MEDFGHHYVLDITTKNGKLLKNEKQLNDIFTRIINTTKLQLVDRISHKFHTEGTGVTGIFLLSESHLSYHTYPESNYISIDLYTCGGNCLAALKEIEFSFEPVQKIVVRYLERGSHISVSKSNVGLQFLSKVSHYASE